MTRGSKFKSRKIQRPSGHLRDCLFQQFVDGSDRVWTIWRRDGVAARASVASLNANTGFQRLDLTNQYLQMANQALDLAQERYKLGLSSIVELSQAQLSQTQAEIEQVSAKYDYAYQVANLNYQIGVGH